MAAFFTRIVLNFRALPILAIFIWSLFSESFVYAAQSDVDCLRGIQSSLKDPNGVLATWNFTNKSDGFICTFIGIDCWHPYENKVLNIRLGDMGLEGTFPLGVAGCSSMTGLDLSNNKIYGNIPNNISTIVKFLTSLDLSNNELSGEIPLDLAKCEYLNVLKLDNNQLTGQIPAQFALLSRMKTFSVSNNRLNGSVPSFSKNLSITAENYANNTGLCGDPLPACPGGGASKKTKLAPIVGAAVGFFFFFYWHLLLYAQGGWKEEGRRSSRQQMGKEYEGFQRHQGKIDLYFLGISAFTYNNYLAI
ncbi:Leucine-rich repeat protein kinase family protein [Abeliophyllum distichum]|uniref:Leucine-rich repeat protein kinase family protein n=1 Tax=Abeliophyllum distichum TaxID=126358 RepID=A0ABD1Q3T2_9LAMI